MNTQCHNMHVVIWGWKTAPWVNQSQYSRNVSKVGSMNFNCPISYVRMKNTHNFLTALTKMVDRIQKKFK